MSERYRNAAQQRLCRVIGLLAGREIDGAAPSALAKALGTHPSNLTRDLYNLQEAGFAERIGDSDLWRLSPKFVQIAVSFFNQMDSAQARIDEVKQRYTRDR